MRYFIRVVLVIGVLANAVGTAVLPLDPYCISRLIQKESYYPNLEKAVTRVGVAGSGYLMNPFEAVAGYALMDLMGRSARVLILGGSGETQTLCGAFNRYCVPQTSQPSPGEETLVEVQSMEHDFRTIHPSSIFGLFPFDDPPNIAAIFAPAFPQASIHKEIPWSGKDGRLDLDRALGLAEVIGLERMAVSFPSVANPVDLYEKIWGLGYEVIAITLGVLPFDDERAVSYQTERDHLVSLEDEGKAVLWRPGGEKADPKGLILIGLSTVNSTSSNKPRDLSPINKLSFKQLLRAASTQEGPSLSQIADNDSLSIGYPLRILHNWPKSKRE